MVGNQLILSQILKEADRRINYDFEEFEDEDYVEEEEFFEDVGDREYFNVHDSGDGFSEDVMDVQQDKRTQVVCENSHIVPHTPTTYVAFCMRHVIQATFLQCSETTGWLSKKVSGTTVRCKFTFQYTDAGISSSSVSSI